MAAPLKQPPLEEMMRNLNVDPSADMAPLKAESTSDAISCVSSSGDAASSVKGNDMDHEYLLVNDQSVPYPTSGYCAYSYPGFDGGVGDFGEQGYFVCGDGWEIQYPVMQADNGSFMYFMPGLGYQPGYSAYSPYLPVPTAGVNGQYFSQHVYPSTHVLQPSIVSPGYLPTPLPYEHISSSPYVWDPSCLVEHGAYGSSISSELENLNSKSCTSSPTPSQPQTAIQKSLTPDFSYPLLNKKSSVSSPDVSSGHGMQNQLKPANKASKIGSTFQRVPKFPSYNQRKGGLVCQNSPVNPKANARGWVVTEKMKTRNRASNDLGLLNEQNHGPKTVNSIIDAPSVAADVIGNSNILSSPIRRDQYNLPDFLTKYDHALFFVIKSYSEDDIHKSIKYNVWASTPNGNKRLDNAFQDAQQRTADKSSKCPVFLFFSVNASGQFCGVAEMIGRVDFNKNMDFWQQDKWNGYFPIKWHIIKDVPNLQLRHIILENNENKPVTNSRDTQEVKFQQGIEILDIFKKYASKTSVLDDFDFYESREKMMQEKRIKPALPHFAVAQEVDEVAGDKGGE